MIVVDALDEADPSRDRGHFELPIMPRQWPAHVYVIATARANPGRVPTYLRYWARREEATRVDLSPYLPPEAVRDLVAESPEPALQARAQDDAFIRRLRQVTGGYPLYLTHLLDELERTVGSEEDAGGGSTSVDLLSSVPDSFAAYVRDRLNLDGLSETLYDDGQAAKLLDLLAVAEGALATRDLLSEDLTGYASSRQLEGLPWRVTRWLSIRQDEGEAQNGSRLYAFAHPKIAEVYRDESAGGGVGAQKMLAKYGLRWAETGSRYALRHTARHLRQIGDHDGLYDLLRDEDFWCAQVEAFGGYDATYQAFREGIGAYVNRDGETPEDDARLCRLALDAGLVAQEAQKSATEAFRWAEEGRMADALQRIEVLDEKRYFLAALRLLWIEADRQAARPGPERSMELALRVLSAVEARIKPGTQTIDWSDFASRGFMTWWTGHMLGAMPELCISRMVVRSSEMKQIAQSLTEQIGKKEGPIENSLSQLVLEVTRQIDYDRERADALLDIAQALIAAGDEAQAQAVFQEALDVAGKINYDGVRVSMLSRIAGALAAAGDMRWALEVTNTVDDGWHAKILAGIAGALAAAGDEEQAQAVLDKALEVADTIDDEVRAGALSMIAETLATTGAKEQALKAADMIDHDRVRAETLSRIAGALATARAGGQTHFVSEKAPRVADATDDRWRPETLSRIAGDLAAAGDEEQAQAVFEQALEVADVIDNSEMRAGALSEIAGDLATAGDMEQQAQAVFQEALEVADVIDNSEMRAGALSKIARGFAAAGDMEQALKIADMIDDDRVRTGPLSKIARGFAAAGAKEQALKTADMIDHDDVRVWALFKIAETFATSGDMKQALEVVDTIDDEVRAGALSMIAETFATTGATEQALKTADMIDDDRVRAETLSRIAGDLAAAGDEEQAQAVFDQALKTADMIDDDRVRAETLSEIAGDLATAGDMEQQAQAVFQEALEVAYVIDNSEMRAGALSEIARDLATAGDMEQQAQAVFREALEVAITIGYPKTRAWALSKIAVNLTAAGAKERALKIADIIDDDEVRSRALSKIAAGFATAGDMERALKIADMIDDDEVRSRALSKIAAGFAAAGDEEQAQAVFEQALEVADTVDEGEMRAEVLSKIAEAFAAAEEVEMATNQFSKFELSRDAWVQYLSDWRTALLHYERTTRSPHLRKSLRKSFTLYPFDLEVSFSGIYTLVQAHVQAGTMEYARAIVRQCPELGLDILLQGFE